jgi:hypothetical protein
MASVTDAWSASDVLAFIVRCQWLDFCCMLVLHYMFSDTPKASIVFDKLQRSFDVAGFIIIGENCVLPISSKIAVLRTVFPVHHPNPSPQLRFLRPQARANEGLSSIKSFSIRKGEKVYLIEYNCRSYEKITLDPVSRDILLRHQCKKRRSTTGKSNL